MTQFMLITVGILVPFFVAIVVIHRMLKKKFDLPAPTEAPPRPQVRKTVSGGRVKSSAEPRR